MSWSMWLKLSGLFLEGRGYRRMIDMFDFHLLSPFCLNETHRTLQTFGWGLISP